MRFLISCLISLAVVFSGVIVFASGTCPTLTELQNKNNYYQTQALSMMSGKSSTDNADPLLREQTEYYNSLLPNCLNYLKTTSKPDCSKITVMATGFTMAKDSDKAVYKSKILGLKPQLTKSCPIETSAIDYLVK